VEISSKKPHSETTTNVEEQKAGYPSLKMGKCNCFSFVIYISSEDLFNMIFKFTFIEAIYRYELQFFAISKAINLSAETTVNSPVSTLTNMPFVTDGSKAEKRMVPSSVQPLSPNTAGTDDVISSDPPSTVLFATTLTELKNDPSVAGDVSNLKEMGGGDRTTLTSIESQQSLPVQSDVPDVKINQNSKKNSRASKGVRSVPQKVQSVNIISKTSPKTNIPKSNYIKPQYMNIANAPELQYIPFNKINVSSTTIPFSSTSTALKTPIHSEIKEYFKPKEPDKKTGDITTKLWFLARKAPGIEKDGQRKTTEVMPADQKAVLSRAFVELSTTEGSLAVASSGYSSESRRDSTIGSVAGLVETTERERMITTDGSSPNVLITPPFSPVSIKQSQMRHLSEGGITTDMSANVESVSTSSIIKEIISTDVQTGMKFAIVTSVEDDPLIRSTAETVSLQEFETTVAETTTTLGLADGSESTESFGKGLGEKGTFTSAYIELEPPVPSTSSELVVIKNIMDCCSEKAFNLLF